LRSVRIRASCRKFLTARRPEPLFNDAVNEAADFKFGSGVGTLPHLAATAAGFSGFLRDTLPSVGNLRQPTAYIAVAKW
jgi:hypothetical protein